MAKKNISMKYYGNKLYMKDLFSSNHFCMYEFGEFYKFRIILIDMVSTNDVKQTEVHTNE